METLKKHCWLSNKFPINFNPSWFSRFTLLLSQVYTQALNQFPCSKAVSTVTSKLLAYNHMIPHHLPLQAAKSFLWVMMDHRWVPFTRSWTRSFSQEFSAAIHGAKTAEYVCLYKMHSHDIIWMPGESHRDWSRELLCLPRITFLDKELLSILDLINCRRNWILRWPKLFYVVPTFGSHFFLFVRFQYFDSYFWSHSSFPN